MFHEVSRAGSIRKASEAMGVSPSSVSRQVAILERQMGTRLVERTTGGVKLTHAGKLVSEYARGVVVDFDSLKTDLDDMRVGRRKLLRLTTVESVVAAGPCRAMAIFNERYNDLTFNLTLLPAPKVVEAVKKNFCDLGVTMNPVPDPDLQTMAIIEEPIVLATPQGSPFFERESVTLEEVLRSDIAAPDESFGVRRILQTAADIGNIALRPIMTTNTFEALRDFSRASGVPAVLPRRAVHNHSGEVTLRAIPIQSDALADGALHVIALRDRRLPHIVSLFAKELVRQIQATSSTLSTL